jgi:hypothetical protein
VADSLLIDVDQKRALASFDVLPTALARRIARENVATANRFVLEARSRVRVRFGFLRDAIDWVQSAKTGDIFVGIARRRTFVIPGTRRFNGKSSKARPSNYAHLIERGHAGPSFAPPYPFMRPAAEAVRASHEGRVLESMIDALRDTGLGD